MYNYPCAWTYTTKTRIGLSTTNSKFNHKLSGSPTETRCQVAVHSSTTDSTVPLWKKIVPKQEVPKLITSKEQILKYYTDVFEVTGKFPGPPYYVQLDPGVPPKQTPCCLIPVHLYEAF